MSLEIKACLRLITLNILYIDATEMSPLRGRDEGNGALLLSTYCIPSRPRLACVRQPQFPVASEAYNLVTTGNIPMDKRARCLE